MDRSDYQTDEQKVPSTRKSTFKSSFFGGIIGGFLAAAVAIALFLSGGTPDTKVEDHAASDPDINETSPVTTVSTSDTEGLKIDEISEAIVGVVNVRQQDIWTQSEDANVGSGIIYKKENDKAYIVTNNHVVKDAEEVEVDIKEDERIKAKVLGTDELSDLAVLEIDGKHVDYVAELGLSADLHVGETVFAIGNPLGLNFSGSVTKGIISGLDRSVKVDTSGQNRTPDWEMQVIQTDAAINPGNSGGALVNSKGKIIGINSMKIARATVEGIGFAIPIDTALPIMEQLEENGEVSRPFIGIAAASVNEVPMQHRHNIKIPDNFKGGVVIASVEASSPAEEAGLKQYDVITKINDVEIHSMLDLRKYLYSEVNVGDSVKLEGYRDGEELKVELELTE